VDQKKRNITIVDVAAKAGVSKTTISRYLNGKFEFMSNESKAKITQVIEELAYRPNNLARSLKSKRSRLIGVIVSDITNPFSAILLKGIGDCCERYGYGVLITNTDDNPKKERDYILAMLDQRVEGIILNTTGKNNEFLQQLAQSGITIILADRPIDISIFDVIRTADREITFTALRHLKMRGFTRVGFFSEPLENGTRLSRSQAYRDACYEIFGIEPQTYIIDKTNQNMGDVLIEEFRQKNRGQRMAIYTGNGIATLYVVQALKRMGISFPNEIGICGFDNWDWTDLVDGGITVVAQPSYKVGRECVKRMMFRLHRNHNAAPRRIELPCELVIRNST